MDAVNEKPQNAEKMSVYEECNYDITVKYCPETDMSKVPFQATPARLDMIHMLLFQQIFYQNLMQLSLSI